MERTDKSKSPEVILCAAIWYKELEMKKEEVLRPRGFSPYNVETGIVFCGWRHPCVLYQMVAMTGLRHAEAGESVQGFLTSKNRFVDRHEALAIAIKQKQVNAADVGNQLYSEDLY